MKGITNVIWRQIIDEEIIGTIWKQGKMRAKGKEIFINNISEVFTDTGKIPDVISDLENMFMYLGKIFADEDTFGKIPIKSLIKLSSVDSAATLDPEEFDIPDIIKIADEYQKKYIQQKEFAS